MSVSGLVASMRGTDVTRWIRKGVFASATRYADSGLLAIPLIVQPARQGYTTFHRFIPSHGDALTFREHTA